MVGISLLMNPDEVPERALIKIAAHGEVGLMSSLPIDGRETGRGTDN